MDRIVLAVLALLAVTPIPQLLRPSVRRADLGSLGPETLLDLYKLQATFWDHVTRNGVIPPVMEAERRRDGDEKVLLIATGGLTIAPSGVPGNKFLWVTKAQAMEQIADSKRNRDSTNPLTAATADSDPQVFSAEEAFVKWSGARARLKDGERLDDVLLWTSVFFGGMAAVLAALAIIWERARANRVPETKATPAAHRKRLFVVFAGLALACGNIVLFVLGFPDAVAPVVALSACALALVIHVAQIRMNTRAAAKAVAATAALLLAVTGAPTFAGGFTKAEEAKLGRCLDSKKRDAAACKSDCYGTFRPGQVDDQGRNLRDMCSLACKYTALDECCARLKIDCSK